MEETFQPATRLRGIQKSMIRQVFDRARPGSINLGLGEPDLPTPDVVRREAARGFAFDAAEFLPALTPRTKAVVCISPSNPTGRVLAREDLAAMADALSGTGVYVISDEIYRDIYFTDERPASASEFYGGRVIVLGGLSKSMSMTGWRLGWLCGDQDVVRSALVLHGYTTTCASTVSQKAALAAWTEEAAAARA